MIPQTPMSAVFWWFPRKVWNRHFRASSLAEHDGLSIGRDVLMPNQFGSCSEKLARLSSCSGFREENSADALAQRAENCSRCSDQIGVNACRINQSDVRPTGCRPSRTERIISGARKASSISC